MKKIMVMGAGRGQVPIINLSKNSGFETLVASIPGNYPGIELADKFCEVDVRDKEMVLEVAKKEQVDGVISDQIDISVPTTAYVTEKLGLPSITYECSLKFTNKFVMKNECKKLNIKTSDYFRVLTLDEAKIRCQEIGFPVVIKPTDSESSKGVSLVRSEEELVEKFNGAREYSGDNSIIIEKFIEGQEYVVEGFASNYKYTNLAIAKREYFDVPDLFIPKMNIFGPYEGDETKERLLEINKRLVEGFGLKFGMTHSEYIVDHRTGEAHLVEIAARGGGNYISSDIIPLATGIDFNRHLLDLVVGNKTEIEIPNLETNIAGYISFTLPKGVVGDIRGVEEAEQLPGVHKIILETVHVGMETNEMADKSGRMGPLIVMAKTYEELDDTIAKVKDILQIDVETDEGIKGIIW